MRISNEEVKRICRELYACGYKQSDLSKLLDTPKSTIHIWCKDMGIDNRIYYFIDEDGYKRVRSSEDKRYYFEHRIVMEKHLGRKLTREEAVHHKDGNKLNNNIENLFLCANNSEHMRLHKTELPNKKCLYCNREFEVTTGLKKWKKRKYCSDVCKFSDRRGEKHIFCKITAVEVLEIRSLFEQGVRQRDIAKKFGVTNQYIYSIVRRKAWKYI